MKRHCARSGCNGSAAATLTYAYIERSAWIDALSDDAHPMTHDLCAPHADTLSVPRGWQLEDRRVAAEPLFRSALAS